MKDLDKRVAIVTTLQPETHYSRYLIGSLDERCQGDFTLLIYADKNPCNRHLDYENLKLVWTPTVWFPLQIVRQALVDKPAIIHVQHEINMYGGPITAILFPLLLLLLRFTGAKLIVTIHSVVSADQIDAEFMRTFSWSPSKFLIHLARLFFSFLYHSIARLADRIIVHAVYMGALLQEHYDVPLAKIVVIPIGVPARPVVAGELMDLDWPWAALLKGKRVILYFGYITRRKGMEYLIEAFQKLASRFPNYVLVLAGGELDYQRDYARSLREKSAESDWADQIVFTSFVAGAVIENLFAQCEFVVLPYTYSISSSLPLSFAMQYGKPVIATQLGTLAEEVEDGITGLLVPPRDVAALVEAMRQLITDGEMLRRLSENTRRKGQQRTWMLVADQTQQVYRHIRDNLIV